MIHNLKYKNEWLKARAHSFETQKYTVFLEVLTIYFTIKYAQVLWTISYNVSSKKKKKRFYTLRKLDLWHFYKVYNYVIKKKIAFQYL